MKTATALLAAVALTSAIAACGGRECTECPDVVGTWDMTIGNWNLSSNCTWYARTGTLPITIDQDPPKGSKVKVHLDDMLLNGTISEANQLSATVSNRTVVGAVTEIRTDTLFANIAAAADTFTGTWSATFSETGSGSGATCTANSQVSGKKR